MAEDTQPKLLSVEAILAAAPKPAVETLEIAEWGGAVQVRGLTRAEWFYANTQARNPRTGQVDSGLLDQEIFVAGVMQPRFTREQYKVLSHTLSVPTAKVMGKIIELSGVGEGAVSAAERTFQDGQREAL
jgi:hypothetical protein